MQITVKHPLADNAPFYAKKLKYKVFVTWLFTVLVVLAGFKYASEAVSALLMKLHELFIQKMH